MRFRRQDSSSMSKQRARSSRSGSSVGSLGGPPLLPLKSPLPFVAAPASFPFAPFLPPASFPFPFFPAAAAAAASASAAAIAFASAILWISSSLLASSARCHSSNRSFADRIGHNATICAMPSLSARSYSRICDNRSTILWLSTTKHGSSSE